MSKENELLKHLETLTNLEVTGCTIVSSKPKTMQIDTPMGTLNIPMQDLRNFNKISKICLSELEFLVHLHGSPKKEIWDRVIEALLEHAQREDLPPDVDEDYVLKFEIAQIIKDLEITDDISLFNRGKILEHSNSRWLRFPDVLKAVKKKLTNISNKKLVSVLQDLGCEGFSNAKKFDGKTLRVWKLPHKFHGIDEDCDFEFSQQQTTDRQAQPSNVGPKPIIQHDPPPRIPPSWPNELQ